MGLNGQATAGTSIIRLLDSSNNTVMTYDVSAMYRPNASFAYQATSQNIAKVKIESTDETWGTASNSH